MICTHLVFPVCRGVGILASKRCDGVKITGNNVTNGQDEAAGIYLYRSCDDSEISGESQNLMDSLTY